MPAGGITGARTTATTTRVWTTLQKGGSTGNDKRGTGNGNVEAVAVRATRWTRPASDESEMGTPTMMTC